MPSSLDLFPIDQTGREFAGENVQLIVLEANVRRVENINYSAGMTNRPADHG